MLSSPLLDFFPLSFFLAFDSATRYGGLFLFNMVHKTNGTLCIL